MAAKRGGVKTLFQTLGEATGTTIESLADLDIGDAIRIHRLHNLPMPAGLTEEDIKLIIAADEFTL